MLSRIMYFHYPILVLGLCVGVVNSCAPTKTSTTAAPVSAPAAAAVSGTNTNTATNTAGTQAAATPAAATGTTNTAGAATRGAVAAPAGAAAARPAAPTRPARVNVARPTGINSLRTSRPISNERQDNTDRQQSSLTSEKSSESEQKIEDSDSSESPESSVQSGEVKSEMSPAESIREQLTGEEPNSVGIEGPLGLPNGNSPIEPPVPAAIAPVILVQPKCQESCQMSDLESFDEGKLDAQLQGHECAKAGAVALVRCKQGEKMTVGLTKQHRVEILVATCYGDTSSWVDIQGNPLTSIECRLCEAVDTCSVDQWTLVDQALEATPVGEDCVKEDTRVAFNCRDSSALKITGESASSWLASPHQLIAECSNGQLNIAGTTNPLMDVTCAACEASCSAEEFTEKEAGARIILMNNAACAFQGARAILSCAQSQKGVFALKAGGRVMTAADAFTMRCSVDGWSTLGGVLISEVSCDPCGAFHVSEDAESIMLGRSCFVYEPTLFEEEYDFDQARSLCEASGGRLAWVDSKYKLNTLLAAFKETAELLLLDDAWIGLQQNYGAQNTKEWQLVADGTSAYLSEGKLLPWAPGQPTDTEDEKDEGALSFTMAGLMDRNQAEHDAPYICEFVDVI